MAEKITPQLIAQLLYDRKAKDVVALHVAPLTVLTDYLVIASGNNALQVKALNEYLQEQMAKMGEFPRRTEGAHEGRWIVLDYNQIIVHLFHREERDYYRLDHLWSDGQNRLSLPFDKEVPQALAESSEFLVQPIEQIK